MDLVLLFELFSIGKCKTEQSNWYIFNEYLNWSEINQSNSTILGRKLSRFSHAVIVIRSTQKAWVIFREYWDIVKNDILTMQRFLFVSRFFVCWGWQVRTQYYLNVDWIFFLMFFNVVRFCHRLSDRPKSLDISMQQHLILMCLLLFFFLVGSCWCHVCKR